MQPFTWRWYSVNYLKIDEMYELGLKSLDEKWLVYIKAGQDNLESEFFEYKKNE